MKEIFDWLREQIENKCNYEPIDYDYCDMACSGEQGFIVREDALSAINESESKWKEKEAELRASVIEEFAEAIMVKATEESEKVVFDGRLVGDALSLDCVSDMVVEIASQMKGEKE